MLKISIITVCHNMAAYIEQTIRSVLSQGYDDLEYIIIDGKSTDGTQEIIERYRSSLAYFVSEPDGGMYEALNKGLALATGDIVGWLNADDIYLPGALQTVGKVFASFPDVEWISARTAFLAEDGSLTHVLPKIAIRSRKDIRNGWCHEDLLGYLMQEGMFWRRNLMERAGVLDPSYRYAGDFELWTRFARQAELVYVDPPLAAFRRRNEGLSTSRKQQYLEEVGKASAGKPSHPSLCWRWIPKGNHRLTNLFRMLRLRKGQVISYSFLEDRLVRKTVWSSSSPHTLFTLPTFD